MEFISLLIDFIVNIDIHLAELIADYGLYVYIILFLIVFCETGLVVTPFLPGDSLLFMAGALTALESNDMNIYFLVIIFIAAGVLGDATNYTIGRYLGKQLFSNPNSKIFKQKHLKKTEKFYATYGGKTIFIARFVPIIRTFAPFVAGMAKMFYSRFAIFNVTGAITWVCSFCFLGYFFGNLELVQNNLKLILIAIIIISLMPILIELFKNKINSKKGITDDPI